MKKYLKKKYFRVLNKLLTIAALILLLILLFGFVDDLLNKLDVLIKLTEQQSSRIGTLEQEVHSLEIANARLENVVTYQHQQIQELKVEGNTITVDLRPNVVNVPTDLHNEINIHNEESEMHKKFDILHDSPTIAAGLLSTILMIKGVIGVFVPAMP